MFPYEVYQKLREEQRELAVRIGKLEQFIDNHDNIGTNKELSDDYMGILRDQLDAMKDYNTCLVQRIGIAVTERDMPEPHCVCGKAMDNKPKHELGDKVNPDEIVADEDEHNFGFCCGWVVDPIL